MTRPFLLINISPKELKKVKKFIERKNDQEMLTKVEKSERQVPEKHRKNKKGKRIFGTDNSECFDALAGEYLEVLLTF